MNNSFHYNPTINGLVILLIYCTLSYCNLVLPDLNLDLHPLDDIKTHGYPTEVHSVTTKDGYILSLYRIPSPGGYPILFHPALMADASSYLFPTNNSLPYLLANEGYDVWLGNYRGTVYSKGHVKYTWNDGEYWEWTWSEIGVYDVPAFVKYIYKVTKRKSLSIGLSMGTTTLAVALATHPYLKEYMSGAFLLAPAVYLGHAKIPGRVFINDFIKAVQELHYASNSILFQILIRNLSEMIRGACSANKEIAITCLQLTTPLFGEDMDQISDENVLTILRNYPRITSIHTLLHYGQIIASGKFRHYNWGKMTNLMKYGSVTPPIFNLSKITVPVGLFVAKNDYLTVTEDIDQLWNEISGECKYMRYLVPFEKFNHVDFVVAKDVKVLFYDMFLDIIRNFTRNIDK